MALVDVIAARRELDRVKASSGGPRVVLDHDGVCRHELFFLS